MNKADLKVDWATHEAAKYACEHWHYSKSMPLPPIVKIGAWENNVYIGCVLFSRGASPTLGKKYGLSQEFICELSRVALKHHNTEVSRIIKIAIIFLKKNSPGLKLIISFADPSQSHHGGIYQAGGWIYTGDSTSEPKYFHDGRWKHRREVAAKTAFSKQKKLIGCNNLLTVITHGKHRYLMPLDPEMRAKIAPLAKPYPKRPKQAMTGDHPAQRQCDTDQDAPYSALSAVSG